jgi:hypothetical protein
MKLGVENKVELVAAIVLGLGALASVGYWISQDEPKTAAIKAAAANPAAKKDAAPVLAVSLDPQLRLDLLKTSEDVRYGGRGRNIFIAGAEPVKIPPVVTPPIALDDKGKPIPPKPLPPVVVPPPPIDLKFFGFASRTGDATKIFLSRGENIFVAKEGDIVDRQYKVGKIGASSVEIEDLLHNNKQTIPLTKT